MTKSTKFWILILVLIVAALVAIWWYRNNGSFTGQPDSATESLEQQSNSDDLGSIEADANATDLNGLSNGYSTIEAEVNK